MRRTAQYKKNRLIPTPTIRRICCRIDVSYCDPMYHRLLPADRSEISGPGRRRGAGRSCTVDRETTQFETFTREEKQADPRNRRPLLRVSDDGDSKGHA